MSAKESSSLAWWDDGLAKVAVMELAGLGLVSKVGLMGFAVVRCGRQKGGAKPDPLS